MPDNNSSLDKEIIKSLLPEKRKGIDIIVFESIDSTNTEARRVFRKGGNDMLICAEKQTSGRGRQGKTFYSPEKTGIYMTVVIHPDLSLNFASRATTATAVAVCEAIEKLTDKKPKIKWVNDIFIDNRKVCGILTEAVSLENNNIADGLIIGIGINISTTRFPDEIKDIAGSLNTQDVDRNTLIAEIFKRVTNYTSDLQNSGYIEDYKKRCFVLGKEITFEQSGKTYNATALDIDKNGGLIIRTPDGKTETLQSGEISIKV